jgi:hypothetical protein
MATMQGLNFYYTGKGVVLSGDNCVHE